MNIMIIVEYLYKIGKFRDLVETGILAEDYYKLIQTNHYWDEYEN
ncbi:hypothetical protein ANACAC_00196 [Anaerostipes caccae L1-92]|uniref:Uncharacterized protein n=1 Tax=Anaerostipes caccae (strain DSM 14662 / CCUG 47493 / JCM 13470 / NCIMB 13811 / L1-92) TaxID=411490 RepID=B0M994_ANACD|nr:hypothetical protein ANACAC_00196 [Anaerostipes caccae L1-92]